MAENTEVELENEDDLRNRLSPEEYAALHEDDETKALDAIIGDVSGEEGAENTNAGEQGAEGEEGAETTQTAETAKTAVDEPATQEDTQTTTQRAPDFSPRLDAQPVENYQEQLDAFETKHTELVDKLDNGEITLKEFTVESRKLNQQQNDLVLAQRDAENAIKYNQQLAVKQWEWQQEQFFGAEANKIYSTNQKMGAELNKAVKYLANDPDNADKDGNWFLQEADELVRARFAASFTPKTATTETKEVEKKPEPNREPNLKDIPKTLASLPSADSNNAEDSEFAYLDKISDPILLEQEIAKIMRDPAKEARYLRA